MTQSFNEKRSFKRYPVEFGVAVKDELSSPFSRSDCQVHNISVGGMNIQSSEVLRRSSLVYCLVSFDAAEDVSVVGRVMWTGHSPRPGEYTYGIKYISIKPVDKFRLLQSAYQQFLKEE